MYLWPQGAVLPGLNPLRRGCVYRQAPDAPLLRRMPMGSEAFLEMPSACGLRPCAWIHPKNDLVPYLSGWWDGGQIPSTIKLTGRSISPLSMYLFLSVYLLQPLHINVQIYSKISLALSKGQRIRWLYFLHRGYGMIFMEDPLLLLLLCPLWSGEREKEREAGCGN